MNTTTASASHPQAIPRLAEAIYGPQRAPAVARQVRELIARFTPRSGAIKNKHRTAGLTERDALLITYPDQVRAPGQAPLRTLAEFCQARLREMVSGLHLLPFYPWSSDDGFAVKDYFAVDPALGSWADVARCGRSFDLMFDAVINHMSAQSAWFQEFLRGTTGFEDFFVTVEGQPDLSQVVRPRALPLLTEFAGARGGRRVWTTFSADQVDLNYREPRVLLAVLEALLFYAARGARFLRLDAIAFLWKEIGASCLHRLQTHALIQLMRAVLDEAAPGVLLITETNVPHRDNLSYFGDGTNEAHLVYNFALPPLVLHSLAGGSAEKLTRWAQSLILPSGGVTFLNFLASHDGIGLNPARGILSEAEVDGLVRRALEHGGFISHKDMPDGSRVPYEMNISYLDALSSPAGRERADSAVRKFLTAHAMMLSLQGVPGIYFHSLVGSRGDRAGAEASGIPRRINRQKLERARLEEELGRPKGLRARVLAGMGELLRVRRGHRAFHPHGRQEVLALDGRVFALRRGSPGGEEAVLCLHNVSGQGVALSLPREGADGADGWESLLGRGPAAGRARAGAGLRLGPYETLWLGRRGKSL